MAAPRAVEKDMNFMDFSVCDEPDGPDGSRGSCVRGAELTFARPTLSGDTQTVYEDTAERAAQVLSEMHRFYQNGRLCDIVLHAEDKKFSCHRLVLAASSVYFERMFSTGMAEANAAEIRLNEVTACALLHLIEFAYTSKVTLTRDCALETFEAADMLQFGRVRHFCQDFLSDQVDEKNCLAFLVYADAFACQPLYEHALLYAAKHFQVVCHQREFLDLPVAHLSALLREDNIEIEYEEYVYEALKRWVLHRGGGGDGVDSGGMNGAMGGKGEHPNDSESRIAHLPSLFAHVRLNFVSRWYLIEVISKDELLSRSVECRRTVQSAKDQLLALGHTYEIPWQLPPSRKCTGLTQKIIYINTYDPNPAQSEVFLFDIVNKSWSNTGRPCPMASELSTCVSVCSGGVGGATGGELGADSLLIIGGWTNLSGTKSLNQRGAVNVIHEFKVMSIFPTLWYVGAHQMSIARYLHATVAVGAKLFLLGGYDETQSLQASVFVADTSPSVALVAGSSTTAGVTGGNYRFEACPRMPYPVSRPAVAAWGEDRLYVFGGFTRSGAPLQCIQCYDLTARRWTEVEPHVPGGAHNACQYAAFIDGLFYIVCGVVERAVDRTLGRGPHSGYPADDYYASIGHRSAHKVADSVYAFDPMTRVWWKAHSFSEPRTGGFCIATLAGRLYIAGGRRAGSTCHTIDCYDPRANTMETVGSTREGNGTLSLCTTLRVMHENFGL